MVDVSIILPVHNAERWLPECLQSVVDQTFTGSLELCIYNDGSNDGSSDVVAQWRHLLEDKGIGVVLGEGGHENGPRGVGYAKNRAMAQSKGKYLCFLDADDVMMADRIRRQYEAAQGMPQDTIIGCQVCRQPEGSTERYTKWANILSPEQLYTQAYTSHGPTLLMPTWFCSRKVLEDAGGFDEGGKGTPEDLLFFYSHLSRGGKLHRVDEVLLMYRYHPEAATFSVKEETIWRLRVSALEARVLHAWPAFTIWNAGKQGRQLYRALSQTNRDKVEAFCDVDVKKIQKGFYTYEESQERPKPHIPIVHFSRARPPIIVCVKQDLTGGAFETNLASLNLIEGTDFYHFN